MSILDHIPTKLRRVADTNGGEWQGPCPWCGGKDRFHAWPAEGATGAYWCRQCERHGDGIDLVRELRGMGFREACDIVGTPHGSEPETKPVERPLEAPGKVWRDRAWSFAEECQARLWESEGYRALEWLRGRGLCDDAIRTGSFGYNAEDRYERPGRWGLLRDKDIWLPRGITIPWVIGGEIWRVNIRRPSGEPKYCGPAGSSNGLYWSDRLRYGLPVVLVEGEIDAWSAMQAWPEGVTAVATGSTAGARRPRWRALLSIASAVIVAFDADKAGEEASQYWLSVLPNARRWRPYWGDVNQMLQDGCDVRAWIEAGLQHEAACA